MPNALELSLILMLVAVLAVSLFRHWKLPAMLGYLFAGTLIGPYSLGIVPDTPETRHLAEFGVVFLMFSIGLEFSLPKLHAMRRVVFGLGMAGKSWESCCFRIWRWCRCSLLFRLWLTMQKT